MSTARQLFSLCAVAAMAVSAAPTPKQSLLVLSKADHMLAIVDPVTLKVVARAPVGEDPHEVIASSDGKIAYVSNYGFGSFDTLAVIDLIAQKALPSIDLGPLYGPHGLTFMGAKTWFTAEGSKAIGRYDPITKKVDWIMGTGQNRTHMIYVTEDLKHIYTTNVASGTVSIFEIGVNAGRPPGPPPGGAPGGAAPGPPPVFRGRPGPMGPPGGNWIQTLVDVGDSTEGFDVTPDGTQLWAANAHDGTVSIIDLATKKVTEKLQANVPGANRLKFTPDGKLVFISSLGAAGITVLDAATHKDVKRFPLAHGAAGIQMQPDGSHAFIACGGENYVSVIDLKTLTEIGRVDAGGEPDGLAWAARP